MALWINAGPVSWLSRRARCSCGLQTEETLERISKFLLSGDIRFLAPGLMSSLLTLADKLMPANVPGGEISKSGSESESLLSHLLGKRSEVAALQNNE
jgi:hypothetical protein